MCAMLKTHTNIRKVKAIAQHDEEADKLFKEEINFYTQLKKDAVDKSKAFKKRMESCDQQQMFENLLKKVESKDNNQKMPVRMFFRHTFGNLVNDAIFALKKKQSKELDNTDLFKSEGSIRFVSQYLLDNLPEGEAKALA